MTIIKKLQDLDLSEKNLFEAVGQILDSLVQVIENIVFDISQEVPKSNSLGDLEIALRKHDKITYAESLSNIRVLRKTINIKNPELSKVQQMRDAVLKFIESTEFTDQEYKIRVQYLPELINCSGIDTSNGFCKLNLYHGSISHINCRTLIISAAIKEDGFEGQVFNALDWRFDLTKIQRKSVLSIGDFKIFHYDTKASDTYFDQLIILGLDESVEIAKEDVENCYEHTFSFLSYLENLGIDISNIGLTFLLGNRVDNKEASIILLIQKSLSWLKQVKKSTTIHCSIFYTELVELFNTTMNQFLNRSYIDSDANPILNALIIELKTILQGLEKGTLEEGVNPLFSALSVKENINIELICTFSRTLCELIVKEIHVKHKIKVSGDLLNSIEKLRNENILSPWICSYMHGLRILGNKSVHPHNQPPQYMPKTLDYNDLLIALTGAKALIEFYKSNISEQA